MERGWHWWPGMFSELLMMDSLLEKFKIHGCELKRNTEDRLNVTKPWCVSGSWTVHIFTMLADK